MIHGIGTDIVQVSRLETSLTRHGDRFAERILSEPEYDTFRTQSQPAYFLAKRYAAKEAAAKAFGTGFRDGLSLRHIIVANEDNGRPILRFVDTAQKLVDQFNIGESHLSLSDEKDYAIAFVILEIRTNL
ncbi:holo-ACP synthase [Kaarinaea lacus]